MKLGVGHNGRTLQDIWRAKGFTEEEIIQKTEARYELIRVSRARNMAARQGKKATELWLGDGVQAAHDIENTKRSLTREFKASPLKGVQHQSTVLKRQQKAQAKEEKHEQLRNNPRIKGLQDVPGVTVDADGTIGLADLKKQRPDLATMTPQPTPGMAKAHREILAKGWVDRKHRDYFPD